MKTSLSPHSVPALGMPEVGQQLELDFTSLRPNELRSLVACGLVCAVGATAGGVTSYALTHAGRVILANQLRK